jgi:hypothetical protein
MGFRIFLFRWWLRLGGLFIEGRLFAPRDLLYLILLDVVLSGILLFGWGFIEVGRWPDGSLDSYIFQLLPFISMFRSLYFLRLVNVQLCGALSWLIVCLDWLFVLCLL